MKHEDDNFSFNLVSNDDIINQFKLKAFITGDTEFNKKYFY